jgi:hypothetical protein
VGDGSHCQYAAAANYGNERAAVKRPGARSRHEEKSVESRDTRCFDGEHADSF